MRHGRPWMARPARAVSRPSSLPARAASRNLGGYMDPKRDDMIVKNLPLVSFVVSKMSGENANRSFDREDAVAYGVEGLIQAVDSFDPSRGTTFASFAIRRIRGSILDAIRRMDVLPRSLRKSAREIEKANLELAAQLGRWPSQNELAFKLGIPLRDLK